jgi:hypothetical protein
MRAEDRRDNEALYNKMTISELKQNFTEPDSGADIQVMVRIIYINAMIEPNSIYLKKSNIINTKMYEYF